MYRKKLFEILISTAYPKIIEIGKNCSFSTVSTRKVQSEVMKYSMLVEIYNISWMATTSIQSLDDRILNILRSFAYIFHYNVHLSSTYT